MKRSSSSAVGYEERERFTDALALVKVFYEKFVKQGKTIIEIPFKNIRKFGLKAEDIRMAVIMSSLPLVPIKSTKNAVCFEVVKEKIEEELKELEEQALEELEEIKEIVEEEFRQEQEQEQKQEEGEEQKQEQEEKKKKAVKLITPAEVNILLFADKEIEKLGNIVSVKRISKKSGKPELLPLFVKAKKVELKRKPVQLSLPFEVKVVKQPKRKLTQLLLPLEIETAEIKREAVKPVDKINFLFVKEIHAVPTSNFEKKELEFKIRELKRKTKEMEKIKLNYEDKKDLTQKHGENIIKQRQQREEEEQELQEQEKGFLKRLFNGVKNFFQKLFH